MLNIQITVTHRLEPAPGASPWATLADLKALGDQIVSALSDKIKAANDAADAAIARVQTDVTGLKAQIATLQASVDAGTATTDDMANLDALSAKLAALDPTNPTVLPTPGQ